MEVIGAGYGRTGTFSLKIALEELGYPCYHGREMIKNVYTDPQKWVQLYRGNITSAEMNKYLISSGFKATADFPASIFWEGFFKANPNAKVILTIRDPNKWYESLRQTIYKFTKESSIIFMFHPMARFVWPADNEILWDGYFENRFQDKEFAINKFNQHINEVKRKVPANQLLVYDVKEGWEPLCKFLNKPVPKKPFPKVNDREAILKEVEVITKAMKRKVFGFVATVSLIFGVGAYYYSHKVVKKK